MIDHVYLIYGKSIYVTKHVFDLTELEPNDGDSYEHRRFEKAAERLQEFENGSDGLPGDVYRHDGGVPSGFSQIVNAAGFAMEDDGHLFFKSAENGHWYVCKAPNDGGAGSWILNSHNNLDGNNTVSCAYSDLGEDIDLTQRFGHADPVITSRGAYALINELGKKPSFALLAFESLDRTDDDHGSLADFGG